MTWLVLWMSLSAVIWGQITLTFLGDSLTAGYGVPESAAFPYQVALRIGTENVTVYNRGVSGDTSAGLRHRLDAYLIPTPDAVLVCIGANDGLRGVPVDRIRSNITAIITRIQARNIPVILAGMTLPANYSAPYIAAFEAIYPDVATKQEVPLLPFLLEGVAGVPELNSGDGIHPNAAGHRRIAETVHVFLRDHTTVLPTPSTLVAE
jgi:acyl-CoA thioesterase-1